MERPYEGTILLDVSPGAAADFDRSFLERTGHPVVMCHGPDPSEVCPLLATGECAKYEGAHGIVFELDLDRAQHRDVLQCYRAMARDDLPIRAVVRPGQELRFADVLVGVEVVVGEATVADLDGFAAEVEAADRT
jgi:hypothetical protein